ncbi:MAG: sugar nucleotide-binding protein [Pseudobdellovibrio sp.]
MKILVFGAGGMIGHKMFKNLKLEGFNVYGTLKQSREKYESFHLFDSQNSFEYIDVINRMDVLTVLNQIRPDVVLNCIGITLRKPEIKDFDYCVRINSEFPHFLNNWCENNNSYLVHFSTDCVFSGKDGPYTEKSYTSADDFYGRTKSLGEVFSESAITLRGSMIGEELFGKTELLEWAFSQENKTIKGFSNVMYAGVTTSVMAELVGKLIRSSERLVGLYQVSSKPISKYAFLQLINTAFNLNMTIAEDKSYASSKILLSDKLSGKIGFRCPEWSVMIDQLVNEK